MCLAFRNLGHPSSDARIRQVDRPRCSYERQRARVAGPIQLVDLRPVDMEWHEDWDAFRAYLENSNVGVINLISMRF
ncbi:hypothetical protein PF005_g15246 [Phytophthora fragariae]|uniref:Uncharacterized protein n=1 Tax=Phytophthora fragariae TaxID=53985 RepID=A0A6A3EP25_9STRA|nr:hypothetical protein PF003_g30440 [Phytophthora fragariae]KAE8935324.1 hypothetical protein PF009_g14727 [Phytophthora fragariae]KAE9006264.1 hypothetical protein PF011_g11663 [Phytophthora fragariae]KAE9093312.1 hypothetical protein PF010_g17525 [Phytophthora fragariae]KAE9104744.1 hypothetical protein PF007_g13947 [Phytophthora fragariae]